jgi:hypothetical protein
MSNYFLSYGDDIMRMFRLSGKDYNDLGRYQDCLELEGYHYVLGSVENKFPIPLTLGMCVPIECSSTEFYTFSPWIVKAVNRAIPIFFKEVKGFNEETLVGVQDI